MKTRTNLRTLATSLAASLALTVSALALPVLGAAPASAAPATDGWHSGWCKQDEGLTVVVDFGAESERGWEARCRVGGQIDTSKSSRITALEAVGYDVRADRSGLIVEIGGVDAEAGDEYQWWMYSGSEGLTGWGGVWELPQANSTNWFYGVCLSAGGCVPRVDPQYQPVVTPPVVKPPVVKPPVAKIAAAAPTLRITAKPTRKRAGKVTVRVPARGGRAVPKGTVSVVLKKGKTTRTVRATLVGGSRTVTLPKVKRGTWRTTVSYAGDANYQPSKSKIHRIKVR